MSELLKLADAALVNAHDALRLATDGYAKRLEDRAAVYDEQTKCENYASGSKTDAELFRGAARIIRNLGRQLASINEEGSEPSS